MPRRKITDTKIQRLRKEEIDKRVLIEATPFKIVNKLKGYKQLNLKYDDDGNIVAGNAKDIYNYDRENFITVSSSDNPEEDYDEIIRNLSTKAYELFKYIKRSIPYHSNYIVLSNEQIGDILKLKFNTNISTVINELIKAKLIARNRHAKDRNTLVINHNIFFKGSYNRFTYKYSKVYEVGKTEKSQFEDSVRYDSEY